MLRVPSVLSRVPKKEEVKKLLQAPSPQIQSVIKPHLLHSQMTLHTVHPWNGLSSASGGKQDEKSAQGAGAAGPFLGKRNRKVPVLGAPAHGSGDCWSEWSPIALPFTPALLSASR